MRPPEGPRDRPGVRIYPPVVYAGGLLAGGLVQHFWPLPIVSSGFVGPLCDCGIVLIVLTSALALWAVHAMRAVGTSPNPARPTTALTFAGPYRFTRNPMYLAFTLMSAGVAAVANALWPLLCVPIIVLVIQRVAIRPEERYLAAKFGPEYLAFKARVPRWLWQTEEPGQSDNGRATR
jgi:protein-S-isoprenylcysteine O-methyltransferase Ste14